MGPTEVKNLFKQYHFSTAEVTLGENVQHPYLGAFDIKDPQIILSLPTLFPNIKTLAWNEGNPQKLPIKRSTCSSNK
jgi:hypothetical protein